MARNISARRACKLIGLSRSSFAYKAAPSRNAELVARMRLLAAEQPRLGCRMAWAQLRDDFAPLNLKRVRRLWIKERFNLRPRKRWRIKRERPEIQATRPNEIWAMDFVFDGCTNGTILKCFAVGDECTRENIALEVASSIPAKRVVQALECAFEEYGAPECIRCDNGPEFLSWTLRLFLKRRGVRLVPVQPGSPWQNGFIESFNGAFRAECLDVELFRNLADAQIKIALWRKFYNEGRPHSSIGYVKPREQRQKLFNKGGLQLARAVV